MLLAPVLSEFIQRHALPEDYSRIAQKWFIPVIDRMLECRAGSNKPLVVGINGSQGSGKSTLADLMVCILRQVHGLNALALSIDDFYLTRSERERLAEKVHSLLLTRGVPGTHDTRLACRVLEQLKACTEPVAIPRFDKSRDDRFAEDHWTRVTQPVDIIFLEGWCVGSSAQDNSALTKAVNRLEAEEDSDGAWRRYVNGQLRDHYPPLFSFIDIWVMLKAPSFESVFGWRLEQEEKLRRSLRSKASNGSDSIESTLSLSQKANDGSIESDPDTASAIMDREAVARFIQHYQRITEHTLETLPEKVHFLFELDGHREIEKFSTPRELVC